MRTNIIINIETRNAQESRIFWSEKGRDFLNEYGYMLSEAERYELDKELNRQWLFNERRDTEDNYDEESMP